MCCEKTVKTEKEAGMRLRISVESKWDFMYNHKICIALEKEVANMAYNAEKIEVLKGLEPVRKRPGMYIGNTGRSGLNHLVQEIIDNSVDEHLAGFCNRIDVVVNEDGSATISDD